MSNNHLFKTVPVLIALIAFNLVLSHISYSQDKIMPSTNKIIILYPRRGSTNDPMLKTLATTGMPYSRKQTLSSQLRDQARANNDVVRAQKLKNRPDHCWAYPPIPVSNSLPTPVSAINIKIITPKQDYLTSPIHGFRPVVCCNMHNTCRRTKCGYVSGLYRFNSSTDEIHLNSLFR